MTRKTLTLPGLIAARAKEVGSLPQAGAAWGIPVRTLYAWVSDGNLPSRLYRPRLAQLLGITEAELDEAIKRGVEVAHAG